MKKFRGKNAKSPNLMEEISSQIVNLETEVLMREITGVTQVIIE